MKKYKKLLMIPLVLVVVMLYWFQSKGQFENLMSEKKLDERITVVKWDNYYEGNNIRIYYMNFGNENIIKFGNKNQLENRIKEDYDAEKKVNAAVNWIYDNVEYKKNAVYTAKDVYDINFNKVNKILMNDEEIQNIFNHCAAYYKIYSRSAYLIGDIEQEKTDHLYKFNEYWNQKMEKWVAVDSKNGILFYNEDGPLSGYELFEAKADEIKLVSILERKIPKDYLKTLKEYNYAYSIDIDNNRYGEGKINTSLTMTKENPFLMVQNLYYTPNIFIKDKMLFEQFPTNDYVNSLTDQIPTMAFGLRRTEDKDEEVTVLAVGAMLNSKMIKNFYYSFNGSDWINTGEEYHFYCPLKVGENKVKISTNGVVIDREIIFEYEK